MNLAVTYHDGITGLLGWPKTVRVLNDGEQMHDGEEPRTTDWLEAYKAEHRDEFDAWLAAQVFRRTGPAAINAEAQLRIVGITGGDVNDPPSWITRQLNMQARNQELMMIAGQRDLTVEEAAQRDGLLAIWARIKAIRDFSNTLQTRLSNGEVFDIKAQNWPT